MKSLFSLFMSCSLVLSGKFFAQHTNSQFWSNQSEASIVVSGKRQIVPKNYFTFLLKDSLLLKTLFHAPGERETKLSKSACIIELPNPEGINQRFKVVESPVMAEELAAGYPEIKTFSLKGIDDPFASGKADWNAFGFHASIFSPLGDYFIDPYCLENLIDYQSYYTADFEKEEQNKIPETAEIEIKEHETEIKSQQKSGAKRATSTPVCIGDQLRSYRIAIACTGEYAIAATGSTTPTMAQTLSKIVTSLNRVDGVYEKEVAVRMVLVPTETNVIFLNPSTDPFTGNNNANTLINESQTIITNTIGSANFDIGHTFSTGGGGLAFLGVVCTNASKARGITGSGNPVGDPYDIDYVAHEIGHQFNANHTFNAITGSCNGNRTQATAMEPGSGVTIMGYAGICSSNDLASNSIPYFHAISYDEIILFSQSGSGNVCPVTTTSGNQPPLVSGAGSYVIPFSTPFILTGSGIDPDGDAITFSWEETDAGDAAGNNWNSGTKPFFRSYNPVASSTRYFPKYSAVINNNYTGVKGEYLPDSPQTLNFRLTARDNLMGGGGVCYDADIVSIVNSGPFSVSYPSATGIIWGNTQSKTITWDVNGTNLNPINCASVNILISYDSGNNFSLLVSNTPNDGNEIIPVPTVTTVISTCRIKVEAKGNIFYDISNNDFTISTDIKAGITQQNKIHPFTFSVWPNPFNQSIQIKAQQLNSGSITTMYILNLLGQTLKYNTFNSIEELDEQVDLSYLDAGIYFICLRNNNQQIMQRIIKK